MTRQVELAERLPVLEVADDCIVSKMGDVTIGLELELPESFTLGAMDYGVIHGAFVRALKLLPSGVVVHKQDCYFRDGYRAKSIEGMDFLGAASERFFEGRAFLRHESRIWLTLRPRGRKTVNSASSGLLRSVLVPGDTLDARVIAAFEDSVRQFMRILIDSGMVKVRRIATTELVSTSEKACILYSLVDPVGLPATCSPSATQEKFSGNID